MIHQVNTKRVSPGSQTSLREANRARLLATLRTEGPLTQVELASRTGLSAASISNLVKDLKEQQLVDVERWVRNGRRATLVSPTRTKTLVAGFIVEERQIQMSIGEDGQNFGRISRLPLPADHQHDDVLHRAIHLLAELAEDHNIKASDLGRIVIGIAAPVDSRTGAVDSAMLMHSWANIDVAQLVSQHIGVPTELHNDANLAAFAELRHGRLRGSNTSVYVKVSHSVGAGLIVNGDIFHGTRGTAGELGHVTIDDRGLMCRCGNRGCLETFVGEAALTHALRQTSGILTLRDIVRLAKTGHTATSRVIADAGGLLGVALAGLVNLLNPEKVVIGGLIADAGETLLTPLRFTLDRSALPSAVDSVEIAASALGSNAALIGALSLAQEHHLEQGSSLRYPGK